MDLSPIFAGIIILWFFVWLIRDRWDRIQTWMSRWLDLLFMPLKARWLMRQDKKRTQATLDSIHHAIQVEHADMDQRRQEAFERLNNVVEDAQFAARMEFEAGWIFERRF